MKGIYLGSSLALVAAFAMASPAQQPVVRKRTVADNSATAVPRDNTPQEPAAPSKVSKPDLKSEATGSGPKM
jgi:hypothetical protein